MFVRIRTSFNLVCFNNLLKAVDHSLMQANCNEASDPNRVTKLVMPTVEGRRRGEVGAILGQVRDCRGGRVGRETVVVQHVEAEFIVERARRRAQGQIVSRRRVGPERRARGRALGRRR